MSGLFPAVWRRRPESVRPASELQPIGRGSLCRLSDRPRLWNSHPNVYSIVDEFPKMGNHQIPQDRDFVIEANGRPGMVPAAAVANTPQFRVRCDADKLTMNPFLEAMQASLA